MATAVVAALLALVGVLIVRAVLRIAVYAPAGAGAFGGSRTVVLCLVSAAAAIAATGLLHLLLVATPRPLAWRQALRRQRPSPTRQPDAAHARRPVASRRQA